MFKCGAEGRGEEVFHPLNRRFMSQPGAFPKKIKSKIKL
jgi:hypothetical protein